MSAEEQSDQRQNRFSGAIVVAIVVIGVLTITGVSVYFFNQNKHAFNFETLCEGNLRSMGAALRAYQEANGTLPPAVLSSPNGTPWHSWRVLLLPYLKEQDAEAIYRAYKFDEPWNGPANKPWKRDHMPVAFHCPSTTRSKWEFDNTNFVALTGEGTAWGKAAPAGDHKTALVIEYVGDDIPWLEPRDIDVKQLTEGTLGHNKLGIGHRHARPLVLFSDGTVTSLDPDTTLEQLKDLATEK